MGLDAAAAAGWALRRAVVGGCTAAVLFAAAAARAEGDWAINLGQWSWHWDDAPHNGVHHLVALEYQGWVLGGMINSDDNASAVAGYHFRWPISPWFTPGIRLGVATGYDDGYKGSGVRAGVVLGGFVHRNGAGIELNASPSGFLSAGFRWEF